METHMDGMGTRMDGMRANIRTLTDDVSSVKADTVRIYTLEKKVDALNEGMRGVTERFAKQDKMDAKLDSLAVDVHTLRETVSSHSAQLKAIK